MNSLTFILLFIIIKHTNGSKLHDVTQLSLGQRHKLGHSCLSDKDCSNIMHGKCSEDKKCVCRSNNIMVNETSCQPSLGSFCWKNEKCAANHSSCINNECRCDEKYFQHSNDHCLRLLGSSCNTDSDCDTIEFSVCSKDKICSCSRSTLPNNNRTSCLPQFNQHCDSDDECKVEHTICIDNECNCKPQYENIWNVECRERYLGMPCKRTSDCVKFIDNSKCSLDEKCVCVADHQPTNNKTCAPIFFRGYCSEDSDCTNIGQKCSFGECVCKDNYMRLNRTTCGPLLSGYCLKNEDCVVKDSICVMHKCLCKPRYSPQSNHRCVREESYMLGKKCTTDMNCNRLKNARCSTDNVCVCETDYFAIDKFCCEPTLNKFCVYDKDCHFDSFHCFHYQCQCKSNYTAVSVAQCVETQSLSSCNDVTECSDSWHSRCSVNGKCVCAPNNMEVSASTCLPLLNGYCWKDDQCQVDNSVCIDFRCKCEHGFIAIANNLCEPIN